MLLFTSLSCHVYDGFVDCRDEDSLENEFRLMTKENDEVKLEEITDDHNTND